MAVDLLKELSGYLDQGGFVMWPLVVGTLVLWYALGYRYAILKRGNRRSVRVLVDRYKKGYDREPSGMIDAAVAGAVELHQSMGRVPREYLDGLFSDLTRESGRYSVLVKSIVMAAPLAGLLGTVTGMIEMFDSLGDSTFYSSSGGIAGGISQALFTTQMGLVVAVPGMIAGRILDKRQRMIEMELDQVKNIIAVEPGGEDG